MMELLWADYVNANPGLFEVHDQKRGTEVQRPYELSPLLCGRNPRNDVWNLDATYESATPISLRRSSFRNSTRPFG